MKKFFSGVCTAMVTPMCRSVNKIDWDVFERNIERQIASGVDALCILGTTGEASTLSFDEKSAVVRFSLRVIRGRVPVVYGISGNNPREIVKFGVYVRAIVKEYKENALRSGGVVAPAPMVGVLLTAPYYNKCTQDGAYLHFKNISRSVGLPMIVYNIPTRVGMNIEPTTLAKISRLKNVVGVKDSCGNITKITQAVKTCKCAVYCGDDGIALPCYAVGCAGVVSVASNLYPKETRAIWSAYRRSAVKMAGRLFRAEMKRYEILFCEVNPIPIKYAMHINGLCAPNVRPPLTVLSSDSIIKHGFYKLFGGADV